MESFFACLPARIGINVDNASHELLRPALPAPGVFIAGSRTDEPTLARLWTFERTRVPVFFLHLTGILGEKS
jgi:hypothetical protein